MVVSLAIMELQVTQNLKFGHVMFKLNVCLIGLLLQLISLLLCLHLPSTIFDAKKSWASKEQQTLLLAQLAYFCQAQEVKMTSSFFIELYQNFHEEWPLASPDAEEISKSDGNEEKAKTLKQKASELVSGSLTIIHSVALI